MANIVRVKRSATPTKVPTTSDLDLGEIAVNTYDGKMYIKKDNGTQSIVQIGSGGGGGGNVVGPASSTDNALARFDGTTGELIQNGVITQDDNGTLAGVNAIGMDTTPTSAPTTQGSMYWDVDYNTLSVQMDANTHAHVGQTEFFYAKASSAVTKGELCYFTGTVGASGVIQVAPATSGITNPDYIVGIASEDIATNSFGYIQTFGVLKGFDTSGWSTGAILYYDSSNGGMTATYPTSGIIVTVCAVIYSGSGGSGSVAIRPTITQRITQSTGISVSQTASGTAITNTAPDQTVAFTNGTGISVTGTYPNFTITNTSPSSGGTVTSVTGTAPISSSGGNTPAISISQSDTSTNGYLSSTDWNTFNGKQTALVSGTNIKTVNSTSLLGSGNLSVGTVTSVSGTSPISVATGTTTPAISISQATTSTNGYLSSTDWNTFNNKVSMVYPGSGIPVSTGSAWGTSKTAPSGTIVGTTDSQTLSNKQLQAYNETCTTVGTVSTTTYNIDLSLSNIFDITLGNNVTFTFTNPPSSGIAKNCTIILRQDATGSRLATFTNAKYTDGTAPILSTGASQVDVLTFFTVNGGSFWFGTFAMANVS